MSVPPCYRQGEPQGQAKSGNTVLGAVLGRERPPAVLPDRALQLLTFSHSLIVNKPSSY